MMTLHTEESAALFQRLAAKNEEIETALAALRKKSAALYAQSLPEMVFRVVELIDKYREDFDAVSGEACQLQAALGCPCEIQNAQEKAMERIRDLIAAEGELGDAKEKIENLEAECTRLHDHWHKAEEAKQRAAKIIRRAVRYGDMVAEEHPSAVSYNGQCARSEGGIWLAEFDRQNK
jgi:chromosome segregation ATPase